MGHTAEDCYRTVWCVSAVRTNMCLSSVITPKDGRLITIVLLCCLVTIHLNVIVFLHTFKTVQIRIDWYRDSATWILDSGVCLSEDKPPFLSAVRGNWWSNYELGDVACFCNLIIKWQTPRWILCSGNRIINFLGWFSGIRRPNCELQCAARVCQYTASGTYSTGLA
jgi:hypothetical protein